MFASLKKLILFLISFEIFKLSDFLKPSLIPFRMKFTITNKPPLFQWLVLRICTTKLYLCVVMLLCKFEAINCMIEGLF